MDLMRTLSISKIWWVIFDIYMGFKFMFFDWELIYCKRDYIYTFRAKVLGGWLIKDISYSSDFATNDNFPVSQTMVFIKDENHEWHIEKNVEGLK